MMYSLQKFVMKGEHTKAAFVTTTEREGPRP